MLRQNIERSLGQKDSGRFCVFIVGSRLGGIALPFHKSRRGDAADYCLLELSSMFSKRRMTLE